MHHKFLCNYLNMGVIFINFTFSKSSDFCLWNFWYRSSTERRLKKVIKKEGKKKVEKKRNNHYFSCVFQCYCYWLSLQICGTRFWVADSGSNFTVDEDQSGFVPSVMTIIAIEIKIIESIYGKRFFRSKKFQYKVKQQNFILIFIDHI